MSKWVKYLLLLALSVPSFAATYKSSRGLLFDTVSGALLTTASPILPVYVNSFGFTVDSTGALVVTVSGGGGAAWGAITGTLTDQTDLGTALGLKAPLASPTFTGTVTLPASTALVTPVLGTPTSVNLANGTNLPISGGVAGLGTGVASLLGGASSGTGGPAGTASPTFTGTVTLPASTALVTPVLGTPTSVTLTNGTGLPESGVTNLVSDLALKAPLASPTFTGTVGLPANQTITTPTIASFTNATHNHTNAAGGGQLSMATAFTALTSVVGQGSYWLPWGPTNATTGLLITAAANQVQYIMLSQPYPITIGQLSVEVTAKSASTTQVADFGLYNADGTTLLAHTTGLDTSSTITNGAFAVPISGAPVTINAGPVIFAWCGTDNAVTFRAQSVNGSFTAIANTETTKTYGIAGNSCTTGVLPATLGTLTTASASRNIPQVRLSR